MTLASFMVARELSTLSYADRARFVIIRSRKQWRALCWQRRKPKWMRITHAFADFDKLKATWTAMESADRLWFLYGSGRSNGNQHTSNLPIPLRRAAGKVKGNKHIRVKDTTPLSNLMMTFLDVAGVPTDKYGESNGRIDL
jgi:hypothetical protein